MGQKENKMEPTFQIFFGFRRNSLGRQGRCQKGDLFAQAGI